MDALDQPASLKVEVLDTAFALYPPRCQFGGRMLHQHEFVWVLEGRNEWVCDGAPHQLGPGDVLLGRRGMHILQQWDPARHSRHGVFTFRVLDMGALLPSHTWPVVRRMGTDDLIRPLFRFVLQSAESEPPDLPQRRNEAATTILWSFVHDAFDLGAVGASKLHPLVELVLAHLSETWATPPLGPLHLPDLASVASVSTSHLCRTFLRTLELSPMAIIRYMRAYWAAMTLSFTDLPVAQIAAQSGYPDMFHFSRRFRDAYGVPPTVFRRRLAQGTARVHDLPRGAAAAAARIWGAREP